MAFESPLKSSALATLRLAFSVMQPPALDLTGRENAEVHWSKLLRKSVWSLVKLKGLSLTKFPHRLVSGLEIPCSEY